MELQAKVAIITGAGGGIGRATARLFAREAATLSLVDIDRRALDAVAGEIAQDGVAPLLFAIDVSDEEQVKHVVQATLDKFGRIDILVNAAGICKTAPILDVDVAEWDHVLAVNLRSVFLSCREVFRHMKERRYGKIINLGSVAGKIGGLVAGAHYSASKAGVMCFTKCLALQAAPYRINVNSVCPGPTKTAMTDAWGERANADFAGRIPFGEYAKPEEIAEAILFLASDRSRYITGEILDVNGGLVMD